MNEALQEDIKFIKNKIEEMEKLSIKDQKYCFEHCQLMLEKELNELIAKKSDRVKSWVVFITGIIAFLGLPALFFSLFFYIDAIVNDKVASTVSEKFKKMETEVGNLSQKLRDQVDSNKDISKELSRYQAKLLVELAQSRNFSTIKNLLKLSEFDLNILGDDGRCILFWAVSFGENEIALELLKHDIELNCCNEKDRFTPLMVALADNNIDIANRLIEKGAELNCTNLFEETPMHFAILS